MFSIHFSYTKLHINYFTTNLERSKIYLYKHKTLTCIVAPVCRIFFNKTLYNLNYLRLAVIISYWSSTKHDREDYIRL